MTDKQLKKVLVHCESDRNGQILTQLESNYFIKEFVVTQAYIPNSIFNVSSRNNVITVNKVQPPLANPYNIVLTPGSYSFDRVKATFIASMQSHGVTITRFAVNNDLRLEITSEEPFHFLPSSGVTGIFGFTDNSSVLASRFDDSHVSDYPFDLLYPRFIQIISSQLSNQNINVDQSMDCIARVPISAMPYGTMINYENPTNISVCCDITSSYIGAELRDENGYKLDLNGKKWHMTLILTVGF